MNNFATYYNPRQMYLLDGNNIKLQTTKGKLNKFSGAMIILGFQKFRSEFFLRPSSAQNTRRCGSWPTKVVHLYSIWSYGERVKFTAGINTLWWRRHHATYLFGTVYICKFI